MHHERIAILDYGSQYTRLITRRLRDLGAFGLVYGPTATAAEIQGADLRGIVLSGGPKSVLEAGAPDLDPAILELGVPILGVCYGQQLLARNAGGVIHRSAHREYGKAAIQVQGADSVLFHGLDPEQQVWMSHGDHVEQAPAGFTVTAKTPGVPVAAMENLALRRFAIQFHPEVTHTTHGAAILRNFLHACDMKLDWNAGHFIEEKLKDIRAQVGDGRVVLGLSGGVDSSVAALLLHQAIGKQLTCVFVDTGVMRKDEQLQVQEAFAPFDMQIRWKDAGAEFLGALAGVSDPEAKRKIIGKIFIDVFDREASQLKADFLAQGTLYPDVIESSGIGGAVLVKSHHNVGGLPDFMKLKLVEPLRELFKDEVRRVGLAPPLPRPRPGGAHSRLRQPGAGEDPAERRRHLHRGAQGQRLVPHHLPVLRRAAAGHDRGHHGRRAHLREHVRAAGRDLGGLHDRRLGPAAPRPAGEGGPAHRQRGEGDQPGGVRHHQQAAGDH